MLKVTVVGSSSAKRKSGTRQMVSEPHPATCAIARCPNPNSNRNLKTSFTLRMDCLSAGTQISFLDGDRSVAIVAT